MRFVEISYHSIMSIRLRQSSPQPIIPLERSSFVRIQSQTNFFVSLLLFDFFLKRKYSRRYFRMKNETKCSIKVQQIGRYDYLSKSRRFSSRTSNSGIASLHTWWVTFCRTWFAIGCWLLSGLVESDWPLPFSSWSSSECCCEASKVFIVVDGTLQANNIQGAWNSGTWGHDWTLDWENCCPAVDLIKRWHFGVSDHPTDFASLWRNGNIGSQMTIGSVDGSSKQVQQAQDQGNV